MPRTTMNRKLIRMVRDALQLEPGRLRQDQWTSLTDLHDVTIAELKPMAGLAFTETEPTDDPDQGLIDEMTADVAGWVAILGAPDSWHLIDGLYLRAASTRSAPAHVSEYARYCLGLPDDVTDWLFNAERSYSQIVSALEWLPRHPHATATELNNATRIAA